MNLEATIDNRLWAAVQATYEAGNYTGAILDAIYFLSDLLRNKSGLDSDGNSLVGAALGGSNPIIKINSLQTDSERDEQRGVEFLLRGVYTAIRNPRSHEKRSDSAETADVLIAFIDYLVRCIDKSRSPFDTGQLVDRVFDKHFAQTEKYADLLVCKIPQRKRLEVLMQVFQRRTEGNWKSNVLFAYATLKTLSAEEQEMFWQAVSDVLETAYSDAEYRSAIQIAERSWLSLSEIARIRAEHRLIESIKEGECEPEAKFCTKGSLGTWALSIAEHFTLKDELVNALTSRLESETPVARRYVLVRFMSVLRKLRPTLPFRLAQAFRVRLQEGDKAVYDALSFLVDPFTEELDQGDNWARDLGEDYMKFHEAVRVARDPEITDEDIPF